MTYPRLILILMVAVILVVSPVAADEVGIIAPPVTAEPAPVGSQRERTEARPYDNPWSKPDSSLARGNVRGTSKKKLEKAPKEVVARPDDPVLKWLPEIQSASDKTGTPRSLIAGIMRLESGGAQAAESVVSAQGLMQVMPVELQAQGIPPEKWQDPATNILAGATILKQRSGAGWEAASAYYFGIGCDAYGTCTYEYCTVVLGWANYFAQILGDDIWYDMSRVPDVPSSKDLTPTPTPKATKTPKPTKTPTPKPTKTPKPGETPTVTPTPGSPSETPVIEPTSTVEPTEVVVTVVPTEPPAPTEVPTEPPPPPTEIPTVAPEPTEVPVEPTTAPAEPEPEG